MIEVVSLEDGCSGEPFVKVNVQTDKVMEIVEELSFLTTRMRDALLEGSNGSVGLEQVREIMLEAFMNGYEKLPEAGENGPVS